MPLGWRSATLRLEVLSSRIECLRHQQPEGPDGIASKYANLVQAYDDYHSLLAELAGKVEAELGRSMRVCLSDFPEGEEAQQ
jgi:hypothetical protein